MKFTKNTLHYLLVLILANVHGQRVFAQQTYNIYFGNVHAHTSYSDGTKDSLKSGVKTPADAYRYAKQTKHLDFLGISEHNHRQAGMKLPTNYAMGIQQAREATEDGKFVALYGMEYGVIKNGGHVLIYGIDKLIGWEKGNYEIYNPQTDYSSLFQLVASSPNTFATLAHPEPTHFNDLKNRPYQLIADKAVTGVSIATGQFDSKLTDYSVRRPLTFYNYYTTLLSKGYIVGPTMDHDNHNTTFGRHTSSRTAVLAKSLTKEDIIDAYRANRFYATQDWNTKVYFTINDQPMGSYLKGASSLKISVAVSDEDPNDHIKSIEVFYGEAGQGVSPKKLAVSQSDTLEYNFTVAPGKAYYLFVKITQQDGDQIITSPIWAKN
ncbi:CehA/McbA family metallohydrolase [Pedobacter sp.]